MPKKILNRFVSYNFFVLHIILLGRGHEFISIMYIFFCVFSFVPPSAPRPTVGHWTRLDLILKSRLK